ncbi:MAG: hypothetical protein QM499_08495 [Flavobacteriaceae bacterium]
MKTFIILLLISNSIISQTSDAKIIFNDGTEVEGLGSVYKLNKIKFRLTEDDKPEIWTDLMVKQIIFYGFEYSIMFEYVKLKPNKSAKLLEVLTEGYVTLYADVKITSYYTSNFGSNITKNEFTTTKLFVKKEGEFPVKLGKFKRNIKDYFTDCIGLHKKIDNGKLKTTNLKEIVEYYNDYCSD